MKKKNFLVQKNWNFVEKKKIFCGWNFVEKKKFFFVEILLKKKIIF